MSILEKNSRFVSLFLLAERSSFRHFQRVNSFSATQQTIAHASVAIGVSFGAPTLQAATLGHPRGLSARSGNDGQETSAEFRGNDHVEEKVGGRTNGVEEVGNPAEIIQFVRVQNRELGSAPARDINEMV